jgi:hypothetical protein
LKPSYTVLTWFTFPKQASFTFCDLLGMFVLFFRKVGVDYTF